MFKIVCAIFLLLISTNILAYSEDRSFKILYIVDDAENKLLENEMLYTSEIKKYINRINISSGLKLDKDENLVEDPDNPPGIEKMINDSVSNSNFSFNNGMGYSYTIDSSIINVNFEDVATGLDLPYDKAPNKTGVLEKTNAVFDTEDIFKKLLKKLTINNSLKSDKSNTPEFNQFLSLLTKEIIYKNPDLIVLLPSGINELFPQTLGHSGTMISSYSSYDSDGSIKTMSKDDVRKVRNEDIVTKFVTVRQDYKNVPWVIMHEMGHTFSLYHDPMTAYTNSYIRIERNDDGTISKLEQKNSKYIQDYDLRDNIYYHEYGKGFMRMINNKEYYSIMSYGHNGQNWNNETSQVSLNTFSNVELPNSGSLNGEIELPYGKYTDPTSDYYLNYIKMKADASSNVAPIVQKYLLELTNDSLPDVVNKKLESYDYEIRKLKTFNNEVIIDEIIDDSSQNIIHTSLLDNTYKLGSDNVVYLSTGNDSYDVKDAEGNIFIVEENEIQDLMELSLEETSKTTLNNFNSKSKLFIPVGNNSEGYPLNVCIKIPSYDEYNKSNSLFEENDYEKLLNEYKFLFCADKESNSSAFVVSLSYKSKILNISLSQENGNIGKLLFNTHTNNIYRDNNPLGNPQLLKPDLKNYYYFEFTIIKTEERFSDTIDENDDNDNKIIATIPGTLYVDHLEGTDKNDILGNPDFNGEDWSKHEMDGDTYEPKGGNDQIYGTPYSDLYIFEGDFGINTIYDRAFIDKDSTDYKWNDFDEIRFIGIEVDDLTFERHQYDLLITSKINAKNIIIVEDFFKITDLKWPYQYQANEIEFFQFYRNKNDDNPFATITAQDINDDINSVTNESSDNTLWGDLNINNVFIPTEGKTLYVGGLKKDKYIIDLNSKETITIRDRGGYDIISFKSEENVVEDRLNFVKNGDDLNIYYKYKKLAIIEDNFTEEFYKERNIEEIEYLPYIDSPEYIRNNTIKNYGFLILNKGDPNQKIEDELEIFLGYEKTEYYKPGIGNDIFESIKGGDVIILNIDEGMKTINHFEKD